MASSPLCIAILVVNETSSSVTVPPTRQGPRSGSAGPGPTPEAISKSSWLWLAGASEKKVENCERGSWPALAALNEHDCGTVTDPAAGGRVRRPALIIANCFANGRKRLPEKMLSSPLAWVVGSGIIRPETNAPHWVQRAGVGQPFVAGAQIVMFDGGVLRELNVIAG